MGGLGSVTLLSCVQNVGIEPTAQISVVSKPPKHVSAASFYTYLLLAKTKQTLQVQNWIHRAIFVHARHHSPPCLKDTTHKMCKKVVECEYLARHTLFTNSPFQIAGSSKMSRSSREQGNVQTSTVVIDFALHKSAVDDWHDPMEACFLCQAAFELARQEVIPRVHIFKGRRGEWFG